jgi:hypothetical protein
MMKKLLTRLPLGVAALLLVSAVPVQAGPPDQKPISGKMELTLNLHLCPDDTFLSWTGTVVIDGQTYGWADEPLPVADPQPPNDKFGYFKEYWTIFTLEDGEDPHDDPSLGCDASGVVLAGNNTGWGPDVGFTGKAEGVVTYAADTGPFASVELDSRMFWNGKVLGYPPNDAPPVPGTEFKATLHIS